MALFVTPELFQIAVGADTGLIVRLLLTARVSLLFSQGLVHGGWLQPLSVAKGDLELLACFVWG